VSEQILQAEHLFMMINVPRGTLIYYTFTPWLTSSQLKDALSI